MGRKMERGRRKENLFLLYYYTILGTLPAQEAPAMKRALSAALIFGFVGFVLPVNSQSIPCSVLTRNPLALQSLLASQLAAERAQVPEEQVLTASDVARLRFGPIQVRCGDAFYVEYRGKDFTLFAEHAGGAMTAFDSPPKASPEHWRKGILLFDDRIGSGQRVVRLSVVHLGQEPQFRNLRIIRAGQTAFEFAQLTGPSASKPTMVESAALPCIPSDSSQANTAHLPLPVNASYSMAQPVSWFGVSMPSPAPRLPSSVAAPPAMMAPANSSSGSETNRFKFTGKELDPESGLYNYGARHYSPSSGRFVSPDEFKGGPVSAFSSSDPLPPGPLPYAEISNPQSLNKYTYTFNNPLNYIDPDGHEAGLTYHRDGRVTAPNLDLNRVSKLVAEGGLDAAGFVPGPIGMAADATNAGISFKQGRIGDGILNSLAIVPLIGDLAKAGSKLASETITVLGHFPGYLEKAKSLGANSFNIDPKVWSKMTEAEKWTANKGFLDDVIKRGDNVTLSTKRSEIRKGSYLEREVEYLLSNGYQWNKDGTGLIRSQ